jgi:hypothetical protein
MACMPSLPAHPALPVLPVLQEGITSGKLPRDSLRRDAVAVDAIVSTIGFPLVGGPAGAVICTALPCMWQR